VGVPKVPEPDLFIYLFMHSFKDNFILFYVKRGTEHYTTRFSRKLHELNLLKKKQFLIYRATEQAGA
jgi:hypothetical protein